MNDDAVELPEPHRIIHVTRLEEPVRAIADVEAWQARESHPGLRPSGAVFAVTEQEVDSRWRIISFGDHTPQGGRDGLGRVCRMRAEAAARAGDGPAERDWLAGAALMDREKRDDLTVRDRRFRIARAETFLRMGPDGPEPPRPTDPDPLRGESGGPSAVTGFLLDPTAGKGMAEAILTYDLLQFVLPAADVPADVSAASARALRTHPGGVLLPPAFAVLEKQEEGWLLRSSGCDTPQEAREGLALRYEVLAPEFVRPAAGRRRPPEMPQEIRDVMARSYGVHGPRGRPLTRRELRTAVRATARMRRERLDEIGVAGRTYRVVRQERLMRLGADGPEPPRPSDWDPDPPIAVQAERDRVAGITHDD
ncbi:hypothetical protein GCM10009716_30010 [Streptomyces sodiiphilus]|uniref:PE-PGRS family protein n=1 Tax=Streptomyces sodiiphilus TaxID=226217 RepID=A0ABP5ASU2_9ACTN